MRSYIGQKIQFVDKKYFWYSVRIILRTATFLYGHWIADAWDSWDTPSHYVGYLRSAGHHRVYKWSEELIIYVFPIDGWSKRKQRAHYSCAVPARCQAPDICEVTRWRQSGSNFSVHLGFPSRRAEPRRDWWRLAGRNRSSGLGVAVCGCGHQGITIRHSEDRGPVLLGTLLHHIATYHSCPPCRRPPSSSLHSQWYYRQCRQHTRNLSEM